MAGKRKITAEARTIGELLRGPVKYSVPVNQRDFAWRPEEQVDVLWEDLTSALDDGRGEYFLGAMVVRPTADQNAYEIVDGQQRMTALSMIFAAIAAKWGDDERAAEVAETYLGNKDRRTRETIPKLTLNETNDPVFQLAVLGGGQPGPHLLRSKTNHLLVAAYERVCAKLNEWCAAEPTVEEALIALEEFVSKNANMIVIEVGDESDAFIIFETLNDRGLELAVSDLVKNYLFSVASNSLNYFKTSWTEITQAVGSENLTPFLRHYWLSAHELLRERELYRKLRDEIKGSSKPKRFVQSLQLAAEHYAALMSPDHSYWNGIAGTPQQHVRTLRLLRATQFRPLALAVMDGGSDSEVMSMLRIVLAISLRYIVAGSSANELERAYSNAAIQVRKTGRRNAQFIKTQLKAVYIPDDEFVSSFAKYAFSKADLARFVLGELNLTLSKDKTLRVADDVSLEHIMPKKPVSAWLDLPGPEELAGWVERIGNLTLLEKGTNRALGAKDFATKRTQAFSKSQLALNAAVTSEEAWTIKEIETRSRVLAALAAEIWKLEA